jgi:hypothetical protein
MFHENNSYVQFKLDLMQRAMPAKSAIVYGDIYMVDGGYCKKCLDFGCDDVLLIDTIETVQWQKDRIANPRLDFYKGDFSNAHFMRSFDRQYDIGIVYDILLHQAPLLHTLHLMLEKVGGRFCIVQPMLKEQSQPNTLVYLPGNPNKDLYPVASLDPEFQVFKLEAVNHSHWLWGMTVSFLRAVLAGEGFDIKYEAEYAGGQLTAQWMLWGCVAERVSSRNHEHWSSVRPRPGIMDPGW